MVGSDHPGASDSEDEEYPYKVADIFTVMNLLDTFTSKAQVDVMEVCGGQAGVTKLCIRKRLRTGKNFDLNCGIDLTKADEVKELLDDTFW